MPFIQAFTFYFFLNVSTVTLTTASIPKGTVMQIEKALIMTAYMFQKYSESFAFQLFIIFAVIYSWNLLFSYKVAYFLTVSIVFFVYKENVTAQ